MSPYSFHYSTGKVSKLIFEYEIFSHRVHYKKNSVFPMHGGHDFQGIEDNLAKLYFYHNKKVLEHPVILNVFNKFFVL